METYGERRAWSMEISVCRLHMVRFAQRNRRTLRLFLKLKCCIESQYRHMDGTQNDKSLRESDKP
jgi:hypothetical protein